MGIVLTARPSINDLFHWVKLVSWYLWEVLSANLGRKIINRECTYELSPHSTRMVPTIEITSDNEIEEAPILDAFP